MRRPSPAVLGSVALHLGVAALAFFSWPERNPEDPKPLVSSVPVSIISETEIAAAAPDWAALRTLPDDPGEFLALRLRAEYDRDGMMPVQVWVNARGEVAALAAVLRKGLANAMPEIMAA